MAYAHDGHAVVGFARDARGARTRLGGVPLLIGNDSVHGHANLRGATLFPHHIGQGCMNDAALVEELARLSCRESHACGINWMFAPCCTRARRLALGSDVRGVFGGPGRRRRARGGGGARDPDVRRADGGLRQALGGRRRDGARHRHRADFEWTGAPIGVLDQGDAQIDERELRERHVAAYLPALAASGAAAPLTVMVSYSSWNGVKAHASHYLVTTLLKEELGFGGLVVSDFNGVQQCCPDDFKAALALALNAGIDMVMTAGGMYGDVPLADQLEVAERAVGEGLVPMARIDDAVRRILRVKAAMRLLDDAPPPQPDLDDCVGCAAHRATARAAVRKSLVLLRNERGALPLRAAAPLLVAGRGAHDLGMQCGGWSMEWLGFRGNEATEGTTIYDGVRAACAGAVLLADGEAPPPAAAAPVALVVVGEAPYAEAAGDTHDLTLDAADAALIDALHDPAGARTLVCVLLCGRPLVAAAAAPREARRARRRLAPRHRGRRRRRRSLRRRAV